ncbi:Uma2 family endonuclease [Acidovorax sp. 210-6]|uniref:Uma2 family endonuclease n=1 Tax=Acidovorax sp. 210-6 TaxID=2699468 RepID=UPI0013896A00|nr:Uma2 family endonuclease [Acidovorax sp. 210-6]NCU64349.1 Uma2 family endonuclease [Acidovorax sp. 210-6]
MSLPAPQPFFDAQAYLAWEAEQSTKHEYHDGEVFAMAGASDAHVTVALNIAMALRNHLRGSPCSVFISDMKLRVEEDNAFFYPDVFVTCAESDRGQSHSKSAPVLVVEVLSPATSAYDRGAKFAAYRKLPTLREYALIDPERPSLDLFRREGDSKRWVLHPIEAGGHVEWASVGLQVPLEALYEDVPMTTTGPQPHPAPDQA